MSPVQRGGGGVVALQRQRSISALRMCGRGSLSGTLEAIMLLRSQVYLVCERLALVARCLRSILCLLIARHVLCCMVLSSVCFTSTSDLWDGSLPLRQFSVDY